MAGDQRPSTREGTTETMFWLAALTLAGGLLGGMICLTHKVGESHPLAGWGIGVAAAAIVQGSVLIAIGLIARTVGEMQAAQLALTDSPPAAPSHKG